MIGTTAALIAAGLIGAGGSVASSLIGRGAAGQASAQQFAATQQAIKDLKEQLGIVVPPIGTTAEQAAQDVLATSQTGQERLATATQQGQQMVLGAGQQANQFLQPYMNLGTSSAQTLADLMAPGGDLSRNFTAADMAAYDPGYQFRIDQANQALAASAAARGGALGGGAAKALARYSQDVASGEFGNAFDRFRAAQTDRFNRLSNLTDLGARVGTVAGGNLIDTSKYASTLGTQGATQIGNWGNLASQWAGTARTGAAQTMADLTMRGYQTIADLITGGGNAQAAGTVGQANALSQGIGGATGTLGNLLNWQILQNVLEKNKSVHV